MEYLMKLALKFAEDNLRRCTDPYWFKQAFDRTFIDVQSSDDRARLYIRLLEFNEQYRYEHRKKCQRQQGYCDIENNHEQIGFFLSQELKMIGGYPQGIETFSFKEARAADSFIDEVLERIKSMHSEMSAAHEILFEELRELKDMHHLGKKHWKTMLLGKLTEMVTGGIIGETVSKPLLDAAKSAF